MATRGKRFSLGLRTPPAGGEGAAAGVVPDRAAAAVVRGASDAAVPQAAFHELVRQARRAQGMTQSALARAVDCQQSAVSMFEAGRGDALSAEKIQAVAAVLGLELPAAVPESVVQGTPVRGVLKYCPQSDCPSNIPYVAGGRVCFKPGMVVAPTGEPTRCPLCAEILEECCPGAGCGAAVTEGSFCMRCGTAYVSAAVERGRTAAQWVDGRRAEIREIQQLSAVRRGWEATRRGVCGGPTPCE